MRGRCPLLLLSAEAAAQSGASPAMESSWLFCFLANVFPILLLIAIPLVIVLVVMQLYRWLSQKQYATRYQQQLERIDQSLRRIADALEKKA